MQLDELLRRFGALEPDVKEAVLAEANAILGAPVWAANSGPQYDAYSCEADELFYGGQAGGGKSDLLLGLALTGHQRSLILRRVHRDVGSLVDRTAVILGTRSGYNGQTHIWRRPDVESVTQQMCEGASGERDAADRASIRQPADLGDDAAAAEIGQEPPDAAKLEVARKNTADALGLLRVDHQSAIPAVIAERHHAADPQSLSLRGRDLVADALAGHLALELGKGEQHVQGQPPHRGGRIELLGDRDERDPMGIEQLHQLGKIRQRPGQAVDLVDHHHVNFPGPNIGQQLLERRAGGRAAGIAAVVIAGPDQGPAFRRLAAHIGFGGVMLGIQRAEILLQPILGRDPGIDGAANPPGGPRAHDGPSERRRRPKKRGPDHRVPVMANATAERLR
jgi:hypothetical protein